MKRERERERGFIRRTYPMLKWEENYIKVELCKRDTEKYALTFHRINGKDIAIFC